MNEDLEPLLVELRDYTIRHGGTDALPAEGWLDPSHYPFLRFDDRRNAASYANLINSERLQWIRHVAGPNGYFQATARSDGTPRPCARAECPSRGRHDAHDEKGRPLTGASLYIRYVTHGSAADERTKSGDTSGDTQ